MPNPSHGALVTHSARAAVVALAILLAGAPPVVGQNLLSQAASKGRRRRRRGGRAGARRRRARAADALGSRHGVPCRRGKERLAARGEVPRHEAPAGPGRGARAAAQDPARPRAEHRFGPAERLPEGEQDERLGKGRELVGTIARNREGSTSCWLGFSAAPNRLSGCSRPRRSERFPQPTKSTSRRWSSASARLPHARLRQCGTCCGRGWSLPHRLSSPCCWGC